MNLFELPLSTELSDVEKKIARAFLEHDTGSYAPVYERLAKSLHLKIPEIKAIEKAMIRRINAASASVQPIPAGDYGHGAAVCEILERKHVA